MMISHVKKNEEKERFSWKPINRKFVKTDKDIQSTASYWVQVITSNCAINIAKIKKKETPQTPKRKPMGQVCCWLLIYTS